MVFGSPALVEQALVNRSKRVNPLLSAPGLRALVGGLRADAGFWVVADEAALEKVRPAGAAPPPFPLPKSLTLTAQFDGGLEVAGQMADEAAAKNLADVIRGGLALGRMQVQQKTEAPEQAQAQQALMNLISSIEIAQQGSTVRISSSAAGGGTAGIGVLAAVAIPSLLRARVSANEAAAIGDVRTVISAQAAYSSANRGRFGDLGCLSDPKACLPGYTGPAFLDEALASLNDKSGYKRAFFPGKPSKAGAKTYATFAYTAVPLQPGRTGVRSFCGDSTGVVCADPKGAAISAAAGACPATCAPLQ
jgi:type II secretory pathway pseudopilin PulG